MMVQLPKVISLDINWVNFKVAVATVRNCPQHQLG